MGEIVLAALGCMLLLLGLAGAVAPVLPGPPLSFLGLLCILWSGYGTFTTEFLVTWGVVSGVVYIGDYFLPVLMTRWFGGSRWATVGSFVGLLLGFLFFPFGIILGPFAGALVGELLHDSTDPGEAIKIAFGSFLAFIAGTGAKLAVSTIMLWQGVKAFFV